MLFDKKKDIKGIKSFDPTLCEIEKEKKDKFVDNDVTMGCSDGCWSGCIGSCRRSQH